jgi:asparagine synthase (glutamine-hydrolysing)
MREAPARSGLDRAQYADLTFTLPGDILTKVDRTSMAVSLEAREPCSTIAWSNSPRACRKHARPRRHRQMADEADHAPLLPDDVLFRPKMGFVTPIAAWLRGPLAQQARAVASGGTLARTGWFEAGHMVALAESHIAGRADNSRILWQLLMLDRSLARLDPSLAA